jgi:gluconate 2-dehydrogenase gamma chain
MHEFDVMNRRSMMAHIGLLIGAVSLPSEAFAAVAKGRRGKRFLSPAQFSLMSAVADTLVPATATPGAIAAGVPAIFDGLLTKWAAPETRQLLTGALAAIDKRALDSDKKSFTALTPARRKELLILHDKAALKNVPRKDKLTGLAALMGAPSVADPGYHKLKDLLVTSYYTTEIALTQELVYEHVPGKWVPSLKITPQTRAFAGVSAF